jgi:hypothetical protein
MGLKSHQMVAETPAGGRDKLEYCRGEMEDVPLEAAWKTHTRGGGVVPFPPGHWPWKAHDVT